MARVVLDMSMSLDGAVAGPDGSPPAGLHDWYFAPSPASQAVIDEVVAMMGALVMGRGAYELGLASGGFDDAPYRVPHVVLTSVPPRDPPAGRTAFRYVTGGVAATIAEAAAVAGDSDVVIGGGARTAQGALRAGVVDMVRLAVPPLLVPDGVRLFPDGVRLESIGAVWTPEATHLSYRVMR